MSYESERRPSGSRFLVYALAGYVVSNIVGLAVSHAEHTDPASRVRNVQINNEQLYEQLHAAHTVGGLVLNDTNHTFTFSSTGTDGAPETCNGKYEVEQNQAHVVGNLACTQTVTAVPTN